MENSARNRWRIVGVPLVVDVIAIAGCGDDDRPRATPTRASATGRRWRTRFALFGDGVAFDSEGNLYAIFDTQENLMLKETAV